MRTTTALLVLLAMPIHALADPHPCEAEVERMKKNLDGIREAVATFERLKPSDSQAQMLANVKERYEAELLRTKNAQARCERLVRGDAPAAPTVPAAPPAQGPATAKAAMPAPAEGDPIAGVRAAYRRAYDAGDVAGVVALYAPDAVVTSADGVLRGAAAISAWVKGAIDQGSRLEALDADETFVSGDLAYEAGHSRRVAAGVVHPGRYLIVLRRTGGGWRIVQHASVSAR